MTTKSSTSSVAPLGVRKVERPRPLRSLSHVGHQTNVNLANAATNRRLSAQDVSTGKYLSGQVLDSKSAKIHERRKKSLKFVDKQIPLQFDKHFGQIF